MTRHGYYDDRDCEPWDYIRYRGAVKSAMRGKRGQAFLRGLLEALDALPEKKLGSGILFNRETGRVCVLGAYAQRHGVSVDDFPFDEEWGDDERQRLAERLGIAPSLVSELMYYNDDRHMNDEERYCCMREAVTVWLEGKDP